MIINYNQPILILGVNGQDGSYLAETELNNGNRVYGIGLQENSRWVRKQQNFTYIQADLTHLKNFGEVLDHIKPKIIYHVAAIHGPSGFEYENYAAETMAVNTHSVEIIMDHILKNKNDTKFIYASSSKVFLNSCHKINEKSEKQSSCLYSLSKNVSNEIISFYRKKYEVNSTILWYFNHESIRRPKGYFVHKLANLAADIILNRESDTNLGNLDFWCDWGLASEYMQYSCAISKNNNCNYEDYVMATSRPINAATLLNNVVSFFNDSLKKSNIATDSNSQPTKTGDILKLSSTIDFNPSNNIDIIIKDLVKNIILNPYE